MPSLRHAVLALLLAAPGRAAAAQTTPEALAAQVLARFVDGAPAAFDSVFPFADGRQLVRWSVDNRWPRHAGAARVVRRDGRRAVLALAGRPEVGNSGHETALARLFTGLYEAGQDSAGAWRLARRLPVDGGSRIHGHRLGVELRPGETLAVTDTLDVTVAGDDGLHAWLNHRARLEAAHVDGRPVVATVDAGLLHLPVPRGRHRVVLAYALDVARDGATNGNFSRFDREFGHVRDQYFWMPGFDGDSERGHAAVRATVRAPADVRVVTTVAQRDTVIGGERVVVAHAPLATTTLGLFYDRAWRVGERRLGTLRAGLYLGDGFSPARPAFEAALDRVYHVLRARFGEPAGRSVAFVQVRGASSTGWHFQSLDVIGAGRVGGALSEGGARPSHYLGHEVAHRWTRPTGPGARFLSEGWATFAEALVLEEEYGAATADAFWERQRTLYHVEGYDGRQALLDDTRNDGISYRKGAWVLRMLRDAVGDSAFARGMQAYMAIAPGAPAGVAELAAALSRAAGRDVRPFLRPWLEERTIPDLDARLEAGRVVVAQRGPLFALPVELELTTDAGPVRRRLHVAQREDTLDVAALGPVRAVRLDPDRRLLRRRHDGELARFELPAADVPDAKEVVLIGSFASSRFPAARVGDAWRVEVPLSEGRYTYAWLVDGARRAGAEPEGRVVRPTARVEAAYPR